MSNINIISIQLMRDELVEIIGSDCLLDWFDYYIFHFEIYH